MILRKDQVFRGMIYFIQIDSGYRVDWTLPDGVSIKRFFKDHDEAEYFYERKYLEIMQFGTWKHGE